MSHPYDIETTIPAYHLKAGEAMLTALIRRHGDSGGFLDFCHRTQGLDVADRPILPVDGAADATDTLAWFHQAVRDHPELVLAILSPARDGQRPYGLRLVDATRLQRARAVPEPGATLAVYWAALAVPEP